MYKLKKKIAVLLCFVVMLAIFPINVFAEEDNNEYISLYLNWDNELKEYTRNLCEEEDISYTLVLAIFYNESRFDDKATSRYGNTINYGLGQINGNPTALKFFRDKGLIKNEEDLLDPKTNIACCVEILKYYKDVGDELDMLYCYQNGEGTWKLTSRVKIEKDALLNRVVEMQKKYDNIIDLEEYLESVNVEYEDAEEDLQRANILLEDSTDDMKSFYTSNYNVVKERLDILQKQKQEIEDKLYQ